MLCRFGHVRLHGKRLNCGSQPFVVDQLRWLLSGTSPTGTEFSITVSQSRPQTVRSEQFWYNVYMYCIL